MIRIQDFDGRFDDLWYRAAPHYLFTTERSSALLRWRFLDNPVPRKIVCDALSDDKGVLCGYAIYYIDANRFAHVMDFVAEDQGATTMELLIGSHAYGDRRG